MAFNSAAGYGNLPSGNFAPEIFSQKVLKFFRRASVVEDITNTDYTGEIENFGDTVKIIKEPQISVRSYTRGTAVATEDLLDEQITMTVDQGNYFAFKVDDVEERHSHINFEALATSSGAYALKRKYDANVLETMTTGAGIAGNATDEATGATVTNSSLGTHSSPIQVSASGDTGPDAALNLIALMGRLLDENNVPEDGRWFVAPPFFYEALAKADSKLIQVQITGDQQSIVRNGRVLDGLLHGMRLYKTNSFDDSTTGTDVINPGAAGKFYCLAGHMSSTSTASHISKTEVVRDTESFSDIIRGLHIFGRKVLRKESLALGVVN